MSKSRRLRWLALAGAAVLAVVAVDEVTRDHQQMTRRTVMLVVLDGRNTMEVVQSRLIAGRYYPTGSCPYLTWRSSVLWHATVLHWHRAEGPDTRYVVDLRWEEPGSIELRAEAAVLRGHGAGWRVWLVRNGRTLAALDLASGDFINRSGWRVDGSWPERRQLRTMEAIVCDGVWEPSKELPWGQLPSWALPTRGAPLAKSVGWERGAPQQGERVPAR